MKIAVNQWCFPEGTPIKSIFEQSHLAGFQGVELNLYRPGEVGFTLDTTESEAKAVKTLASEYGLELKSLSTGLLWEAPLSSPESEVRERGKVIVRKQLEIASLLEMETVLVVPGCVTKEVSYEACYQQSQQEVQELASYAEQLGVQIGIENVWNKFLLSPMDMVRYIDEIGSKYVGAYFDVGNVLQFGFPEQWIHSLNSRIFKVHVKDFSTRVGNITGFVPLLAGDVDWLAVRQALVDIAYDGYLTSELSPYTTNPEQLIQDTARQMARIVEG